MTSKEGCGFPAPVSKFSNEMLRNKKPRQSLQTDGVTFFGESQQPALKVCGLESRPLFLARRNMQLTRSSLHNMVLLIAKNFQHVKFSQEDFLINNPASLRATDGVFISYP